MHGGRLLHESQRGAGGTREDRLWGWLRGGGFDRRLRRLRSHQRPGRVVMRTDAAYHRVPGPARAPALRGELHQPDPVHPAPGVPLRALRVVLHGQQPRVHDLAEGAAGCAAGVLRQQCGPRLLHHPGPFGQHRALVAFHPLDRDAGDPRDFRGGLAGPKAGLDLPGGQRAFLAHLVASCAAQRGPKPVVDRHPELLRVGSAGGVGEYEVAAVLAERDRPQLTHGASSSAWSESATARSVTIGTRAIEPAVHAYNHTLPSAHPRCLTLPSRHALSELPAWRQHPLFLR